MEMRSVLEGQFGTVNCCAPPPAREVMARVIVPDAVGLAGM